MRVPGKIDHEEGLLSLDFIIGFTIFMVALIFVAVMISGLLVHLQSRTIDYDAVAYRTSVILVEDPGWAEVFNGTTTDWELNDLSNREERDNVLRLGLSIGKNYERILSRHKIDKFFAGEFSTAEYREKLIFGDYPYRFNIALREIDSVHTFPPVGDEIPTNTAYGYMKRIVKIKNMISGPGPTAEVQDGLGLTINASVAEGNVTFIDVDIILPEFYDMDPLYRIDPLREGIQIKVQNFSIAEPANLTSIQWSFTDNTDRGASTTLSGADYASTVEVYVDGLPDSPPTAPITDNVTVVIRPQYFYQYDFLDQYDRMETTLNFDKNVTNQTVWAYNYTTLADLPNLEPAVLEVRIW